jgi:hypothetical protein
MDAPTEGFLPMKGVRDGPNLNRTFTVRRRAAKRTERWYLVTASAPPPLIGFHLPRCLTASPPPRCSLSPDEDIPARKKPRLDPIVKSVAATTNDVIDLCSDSEDEKPTAKEDPSSIDTIVETSATSTFLGKKHTPIATATVEAGTKTATLSDSHAGVDAAEADADTNLVKDKQSNPTFSVATGIWTPEEDAELTSAISKTKEKRWGKENKTDWPAVAALLIGRSKAQCRNRWHNALKPANARATIQKGAWSADEDGMLQEALQLCNDKDWVAIAALVPGRTRIQCFNRWSYSLRDGIVNGGVAERKGAWTADEDGMLQEAVQLNDGKNWVAIAALVPGRIRSQCMYRWHNFLKHIIVNGGAAERTTNDVIDLWSDSDDRIPTAKGYSSSIDAIVGASAVSTLLGEKRTHIAAATVEATTITAILNVSDASADADAHTNSVKIVRVYSNPTSSVATGIWTPEEDAEMASALMKTMKKLRGNDYKTDWTAAAALLIGRTEAQCRERWENALSSTRATTRKGAWTGDEDESLQEAIQLYGTNNWVQIAALIPYRSRAQCENRWHLILKRSINIAQATGHNGAWTADEDKLLQKAVQLNDGKNWVAIAALVPGRIRSQCMYRWYSFLKHIIVNDGDWDTRRRPEAKGGCKDT